MKILADLNKFPPSFKNHIPNSKNVIIVDQTKYVCRILREDKKRSSTINKLSVDFLVNSIDDQK